MYTYTVKYNILLKRVLFNFILIFNIKFKISIDFKIEPYQYKQEICMLEAEL
jgi:hypothetical protein